VREDCDDKELKVPHEALFDPNTRPDSYCAANVLLRGFGLREGESKEFRVFDWDNTGEALADYTIRVEHAGKESVDVPAGTFEANHFVLTQITSANTWFKKRAGHVTDFWVLDNHVIVRVLRHREPYEIQLLDYAIPDKLPGHLRAPAPPASKQTSEAAVALPKVETTEMAPLPSPREEGDVLAFDDFDGFLSLDWEILHPAPTHYSLTKKPGTLTITARDGRFARPVTNHENFFLIDCPKPPHTDFQITTCISGFKPDARWHQAGLILWNDEGDYLKWNCQWTDEEQPGFTLLAAMDGFRVCQWVFATPQDLERFWLGLTKRGNRYEFFTSFDGKSFVHCTDPISGHGRPLANGQLPWGDGEVRMAGVYVSAGTGTGAPETDASFEFFEVKALP